MERVHSFTFICFFITVAAHPAIAHPGAAIVVDAKGRVYLVLEFGRHPSTSVARFCQSPRWTVENRQFVDRAKPAISGAAETSEFYFVPSSGRKSVWTLVRQLRGPHLSTWAWCSSRSSSAVTAAVSPSSLPQSSTGRFEVRSVDARS